LIIVFSCAKLLLNMNLLKYLEFKSISQSDFAKSIEVSPGMLNQWLSGHRPIAPAKCVLIEQHTGGQVTRKELRPDDWKQLWPELAADDGTSPKRRAEDLHPTPRRRRTTN
jgi:DNA-binding transcriptional regulator YdaS (Cro superfamily)